VVVLKIEDRSQICPQQIESCKPEITGAGVDQTASIDETNIAKWTVVLDQQSADSQFRYSALLVGHLGHRYELVMLQLVHLVVTLSQPQTQFGSRILPVDRSPQDANHQSLSRRVRSVNQNILQFVLRTIKSVNFS